MGILKTLHFILAVAAFVCVCSMSAEALSDLEFRDGAYYKGFVLLRADDGTIFYRPRRDLEVEPPETVIRAVLKKRQSEGVSLQNPMLRRYRHLLFDGESERASVHVKKGLSDKRDGRGLFPIRQVEEGKRSVPPPPNLSGAPELHAGTVSSTRARPIASATFDRGIKAWRKKRADEIQAHGIKVTWGDMKYLTQAPSKVEGMPPGYNEMRDQVTFYEDLALLLSFKGASQAMAAHAQLRKAGALVKEYWEAVLADGRTLPEVQRKQYENDFAQMGLHAGAERITAIFEESGNILMEQPIIEQIRTFVR